MQKRLYYIPTLNCLVYVYEVTIKGIIKFSVAQYLNDVFTATRHFTCTGNVFKKKYNPIRLNAKNYSKYLNKKNINNTLRTIERKDDYKGDPGKHFIDARFDTIEKTDISQIRLSFNHFR